MSWMEPAEGIGSMDRMDAKETVGLPRAIISAPALLHNIQVIRRRLQPGTKLCAIIKADAYGHDAGLICDILSDPASSTAAPTAAAGSNGSSNGGPAGSSHIQLPVDQLAVACIDEAAALPATSLPILILRPVENSYGTGERDRLELAIRSGWTLTVCSAAAAEDVARLAMSLERRASVQVMVDTGMTRAEADLPALQEILTTISSLAALRLDGVCSHFAKSEISDDPMNARQLEQFTHSLACLSPARQSGKAPVRHAANSGAIFFNPQAHLDMVRPGLSLYGIDPSSRPCMDRPLRPVMKWTAPLLMIRHAPKGTGVGYGQTWLAERDSRIGIVPVGYADGYCRAFSNRAMMIVNNRPVPVVGRVSMDFTTIDLTGAPDAMIGDEVTILDNDPLSPASVYELARHADTIPYEIFCRIGSRIKRVVDQRATATRPTKSFTKPGHEPEA